MSAFRDRRLDTGGLRLPPLEDLGCAALFAFFAMQGSIPGIAPAQALEMTAAAPSGFTTIGGIAAQAAANGLILVLLLRRPRLVLRRIAAVGWLGLLALLAIVSSAWSLDAMLTLRRSVPFGLAGLFGVYFAARFSQGRQLAILRWALLALALATVVLVLFLPAIGLDHTPGHAADWQGVFTQKNACGRMMVLATAVILFGERLKGGRVASLALFAFVLAMSGSRGGWIIEGALVLLWLAVRFAGRTSGRARLMIAAGAPAAAFSVATLAWMESSRLAVLFGRDPTLSGRTAIWAQVLSSVAERPLFGYGYGAFWRGMEGPSLGIAAAVHFIVVHAHNGFLEIALELGGAGLLLVVLAGLRGARQLWGLWIRGPVERISFPLAVLFLIVLYDLEENTLLLYNGLFWVLGVAALVTIDGAFRDQRHTDGGAAHAMLKLRRYRLRRVVPRTEREAL